MKSKKKEITPQLLETPEQQASRSFLGDLMKRGYTPYTRQVFADYPYKNKLETSLGEYVGRSQPELYGLAKSQLVKTLRGEYNPYTSPYYQAYRNQALKEEQEGVNRLRRSLAKTGMLRSSTGLGLEAKLRGETASNLASLLGKMYETERVRQLNTVPEAMRVGGILESEPLNTARAIMSISPILKAIEEEPLKWEYQQWKEEQEWPYTHQAKIAQLLLQNQYPWYYPVYSQRKSGIGSAVGALAGALLAAPTGGISPMLGSIIGGQLGGAIMP